MALMAAHGEITPMPKCAIFADTQDEPKSVYAWLDWLEKQLPYPVHRVTRGRLSETALQLRTKKDRSGQWVKAAIPAFTRRADGSRGMIQRQCTHDFKVIPIIRAALGIAGTESVSQWIGISLDESHRMKPSRHKRIIHRWPLVDLRMNRHDCLKWMKACGFPEPPRSACVFCPYQSDSQWRNLRSEQPEAFTEAVRVDYEFRRLVGLVEGSTSVPFLHASRVPLDQVDFSTDEDHGQQVMFGNECEGMCGV